MSHLSFPISLLRSHRPRPALHSGLVFLPHPVLNFIPFLSPSVHLCRYSSRTFHFGDTVPSSHFGRRTILAHPFSPSSLILSSHLSSPFPLHSSSQRGGREKGQRGLTARGRRRGREKVSQVSGLLLLSGAKFFPDVGLLWEDAEAPPPPRSTLLLRSPLPAASLSSPSPSSPHCP